MNLYFSLSAAFNALMGIILCILIWQNVKDKRDKVKITFSALCLSVAAWSIPYLFWPLAKTKESALLSFQLLHIGSSFASAAYLHFVVSWLNIKKQKIVIQAGYLLALFFALSIFSPLFIRKMVPKFSMQWWAVPGPLYHLYLIYFFSFALYATILLIIYYFKTAGIQKNQILLILIGISLSFLGGSTNYFLWYNINIPPFGNILASSHVVFAFYAIVRYRFMDLRIAIRQIIVYSGTALFAYVTFFFLDWFYLKVFGAIFSAKTFIFGLLIAFLFVFLFYAVKNFLTKSTNRYLFPALSQYQTAIHQLSKNLNQYSGLDELTGIIVSTINDKMDISRAGIMLKEPDGGGRNKESFITAQTIGFRLDDGLSLINRSPLIEHLEKTLEPVLREEIEMIAKNLSEQKNTDPKHNAKIKARRKKLLDLKDIMGAVKAAICLPLIAGDDLIGFIFLGAKNNNKSYTKNDIEMLSSLAGGAAIAIMNAQRCAQIRKLKKENTLLKKNLRE